MLPPIQVKNTSRLAGWLVRRAKQLALQARRSKLPSLQEIRDGFVLRGVRQGGQRYVGQIIDTPNFVLMPGFNRVANLFTFFLVGVRVASRDDLVIPDNENENEVYSTPGNYKPYLLQPSSAPTDLGTSDSTYAPASAHSYQDQALFGYGYFAAGLAQSADGVSFYALDDLRYFTFDENCTVGCGLTAPYAAAVPLSFSSTGTPSVGNVPSNYLNGAGMWPTEEDLGEGWLFHPRRQVAHTVYTNINDPYRQRLQPGMLNTGFAFVQAPTLTLTGFDYYCVAARGFKQHIGTWFNSPPEFGYRPPYYDRDGEQALVIFLGEFNREEFAPGGAPPLAEITDVRYVLGTDLDMPEIHPYPVLMDPNPWGKPALPSVAQFMTPWVGHTVDGFVVFSYYTTFLDHSDDSPSWEGNAHAIAVSLPGGTNQVLFADLDGGVDAPLIPGADPGELAVPTIIGGATIPTPVSALPDAAVEDVAYCFVWEHTYNRLTVGDPEERGIGGRIVVYRVEGETPTREVVTTAYAPLFASAFNRSPRRLDQLGYDVDTDNPFSNVVWLGGSKVAMAVVATPVAMPTADDESDIPTHPVFALIYDVDTGTFEVTDQIFARSTTTKKCLLSAARHERTVGEVSFPAIILASVTEATPNNRGAGKVYIKHADEDGPTNWREYITDLGGQGGAFFVGNRFWWFDLSKPLTEGGLQ